MLVRRTSSLVLVGAAACRHSSQYTARGRERPWTDFWSAEKPVLPDSRSQHPHPEIRKKLRKTKAEWRQHHGHGMRLGHMGDAREVADWEHADGTPAPHGPSRYSFLHHKHHLLHQFIDAGAIVEDRTTDRRLPRIPSTKLHRDWDPEIPLFLEDADERGAAPEQFRSDGPEFDGAAPKQWMSSDLSPRAGGDVLEAEQLKGQYDPAEFIHEAVPLKDPRRPFWNRRLWALTSEFLLKKPKRNKNTIGTE
jgi:hypothetical protein